jgi:hypothetical protein
MVWDSVVGIATRYRLNGPEIESPWEWHFLHPSSPALGPTEPPVHVYTTANLFELGGRCISALLRFEIKDGLSQDLLLLKREETFSCPLTLHCSQLPRYGLQEERTHLQNVAHRNIKGWILPASERFSDTPASCHLSHTKLYKKIPPRDSLSHRPIPEPNLINRFANKRLEFWLITDLSFFKNSQICVFTMHWKNVPSYIYEVQFLFYPMLYTSIKLIHTEPYFLRCLTWVWNLTSYITERR